MTDPLLRPPVTDAETPILNLYYLHACRPPADPTMVWGTEVETAELTRYVSRANRGSGVLLSPAHVLVKAVGRALELHPQFNRRILGGRLYRFSDVNVLMPFQRAGENEAELCVFRNVNTCSLSDIARELWQRSRDIDSRDSSAGSSGSPGRFLRRLPRRLARWLLRFQVWLCNRWNLPLDSLNEHLRVSPVLVNYFGFRGAAPLRSFKPSRFPSESFTLNVTMGPEELRPVAEEHRVEARRRAPLFVRADHRIVDAYDLGKFVSTLRDLLSDPADIDGAIGHVTEGEREATAVSSVQAQRTESAPAVVQAQRQPLSTTPFL